MQKSVAVKNNSRGISKVFANKWMQRVAFVVAGGAVFAGGLSLGNIVGATEAEPIVIEQAQMPVVDNDFCAQAAATCAPYLAQLSGEESAATISPANYIA